MWLNYFPRPVDRNKRRIGSRAWEDGEDSHVACFPPGFGSVTAFPWCWTDVKLEAEHKRKEEGVTRLLPYLQLAQ